MDVVLKRFEYRYMTYEQDLLRLEIQTLLPDAVLEDNDRQLVLRNVTPGDFTVLDRLTYVAAYIVDDVCYYTQQYRLEQNKAKMPRRQNTRYASHGIHEYKGKFNPQIVHALLNILGANEGDTILDPFCGSGTTLVESAIHGFSSYGFDINPLAVQLAKLKVRSLELDCVRATERLADTVTYLLREVEDVNSAIEVTPRNEYLLKWLPRDIFNILERLLQYVEDIDDVTASLFKMAASNLIREYSLQEPMDLRIRRRTSPMPEKPIIQAWNEMVARQIECIAHAQRCIGNVNINSVVELNDVRIATANQRSFDIAITSPPYATALPYIDTQRISLVWLGLCQPNHIMDLESTLIGSREFYCAQKEVLYESMMGNMDMLPVEVISLIHDLQNNLVEQDGFRKRAVPLLLYRYFADMKKMFRNVCSMMRPGAKYALVVGNNKTTIGGRLYVIDTPILLEQIAVNCGWRAVDRLSLQTYQRYGIHTRNAITCETLLLLEKDAE